MSCESFNLCQRFCNNVSHVFFLCVAYWLLARWVLFLRRFYQCLHCVWVLCVSVWGLKERENKNTSLQKNVLEKYVLLNLFILQVTRLFLLGVSLLGDFTACGVWLLESVFDNKLAFCKLLLTTVSINRPHLKRMFLILVQLKKISDLISKDALGNKLHVFLHRIIYSSIQYACYDSSDLHMSTREMFFSYCLSF